ncbi:hypothetical protein Kpol_1063p14 [Vanderwaltozyma polyspora DSM 70294]|uniref:Protein FAF1 n=1 Tax=Vanderwaltozyma polyspora (strain ATCC 22028 / DSM 70294 / BCRC 21397 / CBS 2163 / NBRC 10782 / NRRL Y-8283 / UCD 57-17) TaxID=436907 RepID=A7TQQ8_VANPO|nr:uncharacterized protein Kpol_1063p14 [Vanderwaltozyma polyspora DSM 70294]EDO15403.1 hypothetical protein Kpol_1063p14 [Vanderwaltozyma polyspora DSM 70294]
MSSSINDPKENSETDEAAYAKMMEMQRKAFEAQFGSLEDMGFEDKTKELNEESESEDESEQEQEEEQSGSGSEYENGSDDQFSGFSDSSDNEQNDINKKSKNAVESGPKVIKFNGPSDIFVVPSKKEQKMLRSGKTLKHTTSNSNNDDEQNDSDEDENLERENLQNDLELQQFLRESHLLASLNSANSKSESGASLTLQSMNNDSIAYQDDVVMGKARARTLEMRLNRLSKINGHDKKINRLEKMPIQTRKGMVNKHIKRIEKYEQEAADGGIVLSKVKKGQFRKIEHTYKRDIERRIGTSIKKKDEIRNTKRKRGLKVNSIGRSTRNGLVISSQEIARVNGVDKRSSKGRSKPHHRHRR